QLIVVEVHERVDPVALEDVVADRDLAEELALSKVEQLSMSGERVEQLGLESGAAAAGVEVGEKRIFRFVEHDGGIQARTQPFGKCRLAQADRPLDGEVSEVQ